MASNATVNSEVPNSNQHVPEANESLRPTSDSEIDTILDFVSDYETVEPKLFVCMEETIDDLLPSLDCDLPFNFEANFGFLNESSEDAPRLPELTGDYVKQFFDETDLLQSSTSTNPDLNGSNATVQSLSTDSVASRGSGAMRYEENGFGNVAATAFINTQEMKQKSVDVEDLMGYQVQEPSVPISRHDADEDIHFLEEIPTARRVRFGSRFG